MKKTILFALLVLLIPAICSAGSVQDKLKAVLSAGGAACGTIQEQTGTGGGASLGLDTTVDRYYVSSSFNAASTGSIKTLYLQLKKESTATQTITVYLCPDNAGHAAADASCTAAGATLSAATLTSAYLEYKFQFAAGFAVTSGTDYWIKLKASAIDATKIVDVGYNASVTGDAYEYSPDDSSWTTGDASAQFTFRITSCAE